MQKIFVTLFIFGGIIFLNRAGEDRPKTPEALARDAAIAAFTKKMEAANYPALFEKAAREFNVPAQILEGISFAETRWEHLTWPEGETVSPENGMPHSYGIMSLWDNKFFGHNLIEAARLIGKTPEDLKRDPLDNMRGAAAYLRQLYEKTPKPAGTTEGDLESWRYAIADYTGIPEPDLKHQHALSVYEYLSQGYGEYGIKLEAVPNLKLEPMRAEVKKIVEEERAKREARVTAVNPVTPAPTNKPARMTPLSNVVAQKKSTGNSTNLLVIATSPSPAAPRSRVWAFIAALGVANSVTLFFILRRKKLKEKSNHAVQQKQTKRTED